MFVPILGTYELRFAMNSQDRRISSSVHAPELGDRKSLGQTELVGGLEITIDND